MECFVHYLMDSYCTCVRSTTLDNFALGQTSLDKKQSSRLHSTRLPNALDISLNIHVERCIVKSRERLARALSLGQTLSTFHYTLLDNCRALLSVIERGWPNALDFSLDLELNIPRMYYLVNNSFMECFVHYLMNSNCTCVGSFHFISFFMHGNPIS